MILYYTCPAHSCLYDTLLIQQTQVPGYISRKNYSSSPKNYSLYHKTQASHGIIKINCQIDD